MGVLERVNSTDDVSALSRDELHALAAELRSEIIRVCSLGGGHLASSLGAVELTVALHHLYDTARDRIVWDVGHQTYGHKIITGRKDRIDTIRQPGGLAGFTTSSESPHDALTVGHASTSLAAALGMALARDARGDDYSIVAVIGDGALTGGMALAALNQIGHVKPKMTIVLNDNEMSISENVGALNTFMRSLQVQPWLHEVEAQGKRTLGQISQTLVDLGSRAKKAARRFFDPNSANPFHAMGVRYVGPIDGHDIDQLLYYLAHVQELSGPTMLHIVTKKGKGYKIAESDPIYWHGPPKFDASKPVAASKGYTWSSAFGDAACALSSADDRVWVITPAMREGSGLVAYSQKHPERYLDVGIAEDVAVTTAAGLALRGEKPIVAIYSTFLQRGFDQVIHDVCLENLDVVFAIDRAGLVGGDGMTHQGVYDLAYLRALPNMSVAMPKDVPEMRAMLKTALKLGGPKAVRWPRGKATPAPEAPVAAWEELTWGSWEVLKEGSRAFILALGPTVGYALQATADLPEVGVVNARFVKPLDEALLERLARRAEVLITAEDHVLMGGLGSAVAETLVDKGLRVPLHRLGIPDVHVPHGDPAAQHEAFGYGPRALRRTLEALGLAQPTLLEASD
ncbi:1-deoxy-D-xylulose-5-phosphate synthase [Truepera radiovictrix]|uniref:1-deoxy-D-xylulose-5-phosphate synthase n=1 Tax=Truepera radiovictrix (strain DSM 17093 / CIP 108686 / LMG 22925 / RQ-24) TaxID=649638 RepID=D7CUC3_TRURR|nr:1-deoxy-D-xylulose-5-phosphate synthase [Truepera radiovictrix]ADI15708.1 deoxyxylulose-5-phosphate synthase [Truepera radiovictrix DSM 17093]WMT58666.1 1-deoxy-D-xylulose-5-phosphate synthase [Truepera radiovictrix]